MICRALPCSLADSIPFLGEDSLKPIPVEEFSEHVQRMHADRDKFFELEYNVSENFWPTAIQVVYIFFTEGH